MTIETKFNIGDEVWWKDRNNKPHSDVINAIRIYVCDASNNIGIQYGIKRKSFDECFIEWFWDFYRTKQELLDSL